MTLDELIQVLTELRSDTGGNTNKPTLVEVEVRVESDTGYSSYAHTQTIALTRNALSIVAQPGSKTLVFKIEG